MTEQEQLQLIEEDWRNVKHIQNPSPELCVHALEENVDSMYYMKELSEEAQLAIVNYEPWCFSLLEKPTKKVEIESIKLVPDLIREMENPSEYIKSLAVEQNGSLIQYIDNPSKELVFHTLSYHPSAIKYVFQPTEEMKLFAVGKMGHVIQNIKKPSLKVECEAFLNMCETLGDIQDEYECYFKKNSLFVSLYLHDKEMFLERLPRYEQTLEHIPYFSALLEYLNVYCLEWVKEYIESFSSLTTEQQEVWKKFRLKTLL